MSFAIPLPDLAVDLKLEQPVARRRHLARARAAVDERPARAGGAVARRAPVPGPELAAGLAGEQPALARGDAGDARVVVDQCPAAVSYTHLRAHETPEHLVCRLLLEKKKR